MREELMTVLDGVLPSFPISVQDNLFDIMDDKPDNFIALKFSHTEPSISNSRGSWKFWEVQIYVSKDSILPIDEYYSKVKEALHNLDVELTLADNGDYSN